MFFEATIENGVAGCLSLSLSLSVSIPKYIAKNSHLDSTTEREKQDRARHDDDQQDDVDLKKKGKKYKERPLDIKKKGKYLIGNPTDVYKSRGRARARYIERGQEVKHSVGFLFLFFYFIQVLMYFFFQFFFRLFCLT